MASPDIASMVDHTNLNPSATKESIEILCQEADSSRFKTVCVRPSMVSLASSLLKASNVKVCSVVGFPLIKTTTADEMQRELLQYTTKLKVKEALSALRDGASEIDMVIDLYSLKEKAYSLVEKDIRSIVAHAPFVKVIIETCYLTEEEKVIACTLAEQSGAHFVKTSTGYGIGGATLPDMALMSRSVSERVGIKASGGIQTLEFALELYHASQSFCPHPFRIGSSKLKCQ